MSSNKIIKNSVLIKLSAFFFIFTTLQPRAHALVVAPFIAIGAVQLLVYLLGLLSIPIAVIIKTLGKLNARKTAAVTIIILIVLGLIVFVLLDKPNFSNLTSMPAINQIPQAFDTGGSSQFLPRQKPNYTRAFIILDVLFTAVALPPTLMALFMINRKKNLWNKWEFITLGASVAFTVATSVLFLLFVIYYRNYISFN